MVSAWFPEGKDDPELTLLKLVPVDAQVWVSRGGPAATTPSRPSRADLNPHRTATLVIKRTSTADLKFSGEPSSRKGRRIALLAVTLLVLITRQAAERAGLQAVQLGPAFKSASSRPWVIQISPGRKLGDAWQGQLVPIGVVRYDASGSSIRPLASAGSHPHPTRGEGGQRLGEAPRPAILQRRWRRNDDDLAGEIRAGLSAGFSCGGRQATRARRRTVRTAGSAAAMAPWTYTVLSP